MCLAIDVTHIVYYHIIKFPRILIVTRNAIVLFPVICKFKLYIKYAVVDITIEIECTA